MSWRRDCSPPQHIWVSFVRLIAEIHQAGGISSFGKVALLCPR